MSEVIIRHSVLTFYKDSQIIPNRNFIVESIETYLATLTNFGVSDFQYLRPALEMIIKVHKDEVFCSMLVENNYNYLKVVQDNRSYYYFILKKTQKAPETVEFELRMDTINTFRWQVDFFPTERTKVIREHKDRYEFEVVDKEYSGEFAPLGTEFNIPIFSSISVNIEDFSYSDLVITGTNADYTSELVSVLRINPRRYEVRLKITFLTAPITNFNVSFTAHIKQLKRIIDLYSEGLTPTLYKEEKGTCYPPERNNWYLIYKNKENAQEGDEVVDCYLAPEFPLDCKANTGNTIVPSDLDSNVYYMFSRYGNSFEDTSFKTSAGTISTKLEQGFLSMWYQAIILRKSNDGTKIQVITITYVSSYIGGQWIWTSSQETFNQEFTDIQWLGGPLTCYKGNDISTPNGNNYTLVVGSTSDITLKGFSSFDRTLSTLLKVIAIPYLPCNYEIDNGILVLPTSWEYDSTYGFMKLSSLDEKFESLIQTELSNPFTEVLGSFYQVRNTIGGRILLDPKLYHSDYYQPKFIYDSFGFAFQLEKMNPDVVYNKEKFEFTFVMTSTIRSRFMFKFNDYDLAYATEDYEKVLNVSRNNEAVIYNSAYITYLRTGYNIDVKAKERTQRTAILGGTLSTIGSIAGIGIGLGKGESTGMGVKSVISGASSIVSAIVNSVNTIAQSEESMEKNLATLKAQAVSVEGSDDLDLLENYSENKAKLAVYKVSPKMEHVLDDLFFYTGYIGGEMKVPEVNTRYWFNFLACDLDITGVNSAIPDLCLSDLIAKYQGGVFFLHAQGGTYDFELSHENWETELL